MTREFQIWLSGFCFASGILLLVNYIKPYDPSLISIIVGFVSLLTGIILGLTTSNKDK